MTGDLPLHKCHKVVAAAKIVGLIPVRVTPDTPDFYDLELDGAEDVRVTGDWIKRKVPSGDVVGGYYVVYPQEPGEDRAYSSWSPAYAFEAGYQRLPKRLPDVQPLNGPVALSDQDLEDRFRYHPPRNDDDRLRHQVVSEETLRLAKLLRDICPRGRDLSLALTLLEDVRMRGNAAIACNHGALPA